MQQKTRFLKTRLMPAMLSIVSQLALVCQPVYSYDLCQIQDYTPEFKDYEKKMHSAFYRNLPSNFANSRPISIRFYLLPDGIIRDAQVSHSCGNSNLDFTCLDAVLCSSPLTPPPIYKKFPPPPPADKMVVPISNYGSGVYTFSFQPNKGKTSQRNSFKLRKIPLEVAYRYPALFTPEILESENNSIKLSSKYLRPDFFENLRKSWPLFFKDHPSASKQEIIDWADRLFKAFVGSPIITDD